MAASTYLELKSIINTYFDGEKTITSHNLNVIFKVIIESFIFRFSVADDAALSAILADNLKVSMIVHKLDNNTYHFLAANGSTFIEIASDAYTQSEVDSLLSAYVREDYGKDLSENDFTDTLLTKLNAIDENANKSSIKQLYLGNSVVENHFQYIKTATTVNGVATFYLTDDETPSGNAIFSNNIRYVSANAANNTTVVSEIPLCSIKSISGNRKVIEINVICGRNDGDYSDSIASFNSLEFATNGTLVYLNVIGN